MDPLASPCASWLACHVGGSGGGSEFECNQTRWGSGFTLLPGSFPGPAGHLRVGVGAQGPGRLWSDVSHGHVPSPQHGSHLLRPRSFPSPTKCLRCTSLMLGLSRQGLGCDGETPTPPMHPPPDTSHSP